jgi:hypothetical protein
MQYMARVEMHKKDRETYERLHAAMATESLIRILTAENSGKRSKMPIGTYWMESSGDAWSVMDAAKRAALPIDATAEIVVSGGPQIVFYNCPEEVPESPLAAMLRMPAPRPPVPNLLAPPSSTRSLLTNPKFLGSAPPTPGPDMWAEIARLSNIKS